MLFLSYSCMVRGFQTILVVYELVQTDRGGIFCRLFCLV
eukprot:COSAG05_NODE_20276_length_281_cov_0.500000_1_plen_38_part_01